MEKATLLVWKSKKEKIVVELQFENGKKMPLLLQLKNTELNNTEVQVTRENGIPVLVVEANGKVLFPNNPQKNIPTPTSGHKKVIPPKPDIKAPPPKKSHDQSTSINKENLSSKQNDSQSMPTQNSEYKLEYDQVSYVSYSAFAPYNFIPLNEKIVCNNLPVPELNKYDTTKNTGWIELEIEAITPLYIRGTLTKSDIEKQLDNKDKSDFFAPVKKISIPGSSLRGMTRNMVEIVSFSEFKFFEDRRLYYRGLADQSNLREEYQNKMASFDRQKRRTQYNFSVGILRKSTDKKDRLHFEIKSSGNRFDRILKSDAKNLVEKKGEKYEEFKFYRLGKDFLVVSGNVPNKKRDWVINYPYDDAEVIAILDEDIKNYKQDRTRGEQVPDILEQARRGEEIPCFFVRWTDREGKNRVSFGHTGMFRLAYEKTISAHIKQNFESNAKSSTECENKIDFAEAIFGNEKKHSGRVFFEDAFLIDEQTDLQLDIVSPKILSSPKPTTFQQYLVQNSTEIKQLNHYNSNSSIRGYKCYWHKSGEKDKWVEMDKKLIDKNPKLYTKIQPVKPGTRFRGRVRFENLSGEELGALLFTLDLPEGCGHKLGMGKPLGLGSISVTPTLYLSDVKKRYTDFFAEWHNDIAVSDQLLEKKRLFEQYILKELNENDKSSLWQNSRLQELLVMLRYDIGKSLEKDGKNRYLNIEPQNEFKNRSVLPKPSSLVSKD
ncbi:MAG: TIGR03986 family CRISPR-associated RAMP protein [Acidobacteria bacterium]|nr:TIGR03986 family CRISPR-associated RAMP protein [Acidobacteriota bacterium]